jgi:hypothetical protein
MRLNRVLLLFVAGCALQAQSSISFRAGRDVALNPPGLADRWVAVPVFWSADATPEGIVAEHFIPSAHGGKWRR